MRMIERTKDFHFSFDSVPNLFWALHFFYSQLANVNNFGGTLEERGEGKKRKGKQNKRRKERKRGRKVIQRPAVNKVEAAL